MIMLAGCQSPRSSAVSGSIALPPDNNPSYVMFPLPDTGQVYTFNADPSGTTVLTLDTLTPPLIYTAEVHDSQGVVLAALNGSDLERITLTLAPGTGLYEVVLKADNPAAQGMLTLSLARASQVSSPVTTTQAAAKQVADQPVVCSLSTVTAGNVTIYTGPSTTYTPLAALPPDMYLVTDTVTADGWYRVRFNTDQTGWVDGLYIQLTGSCEGLVMPSPAVTVSATTIPQSATSSCQAMNSVGAAVNVRTGPGMDYQVIAGLHPGTVVAVIGRSDNGWYQLSSGGNTGWVAASGIALSGGCDTVTLVWQMAAS
ncbi:MAG: SH3 domain-containing protein [Anaerolineae bacterium]|nr:SH3 domain-containing protein [Anaerolineae bacterium]